MFQYHIYSAYHTGVDTYDYLRRFIDPDLEYHVVIGKAVTEMLRSLADSQELPLSVRDYAWKVRSRLTMFHDQILGKYKWFKTKKGQRMTGEQSYLMEMFSPLTLINDSNPCLATATHNFKWVSIVHNFVK